MRGRGGYPQGVRAVALLLLLAALACAACGPTSPTEAGGADVDPVAVLTVLPSPGQLRGEPAAPADAGALQVALTGSPDPAIAARVRERRPKAAAVRTWSAPGGRELVAAVSVWDSHLIATGIGGDAAELLLSEDGARAWTPTGLPGSRGARVDAPGRQEQRLSFAVGPNSLYVRSKGPVPRDVVARTLRRLILTTDAQE
jgi:hypothetical protein